MAAVSATCSLRFPEMSSSLRAPPYSVRNVVVDGVDDVDTLTANGPGIGMSVAQHSPLKRPGLQPPAKRGDIQVLEEAADDATCETFLEDHLSPLPFSITLTESMEADLDCIKKAGKKEAQMYAPSASFLSALSLTIYRESSSTLLRLISMLTLTRETQTPSESLARCEP